MTTLAKTKKKRIIEIEIKYGMATAAMAATLAQQAPITCAYITINNCGHKVLNCKLPYIGNKKGSKIVYEKNKIK